MKKRATRAALVLRLKEACAQLDEIMGNCRCTHGEEVHYDDIGCQACGCKKFKLRPRKWWI